MPEIAASGKPAAHGGRERRKLHDDLSLAISWTPARHGDITEDSV